jgi:hypothetical protein
MAVDENVGGDTDRSTDGDSDSEDSPADPREVTLQARHVEVTVAHRRRLSSVSADQAATG